MNTLLLSTMLGYATKAFFSIPVLVILVLDILALRSIWRDESRSEITKLIWTMIVFFFPLGGLIIWWFFGSKKY